MTSHEATKTSECPGVIVYQAGLVIFGFGETLNDAIADANQWLDAAADDYPLTARAVKLGTGHNEIHGEMYWSPATQRLLDQVASDGGKTTFHHNEHGVADAE